MKYIWIFVCSYLIALFIGRVIVWLKMRRAVNHIKHSLGSRGLDTYYANMRGVTFLPSIQFMAFYGTIGGVVISLVYWVSG